MDDYISVGFVFRNDQLSRKEEILKHLFQSMNLKDYSVLILSVDSKEDQKLIYGDITDEDYTAITNHDYINILFMSSFLGLQNLMLNVTFYQNGDHFGFMLDLFTDRFKRNINYEQLEKLMIVYTEESYHTLSYDYALCQLDGVEQISPDEILNTDVDYCFLVKPNGEELMIKHGE